MFGGEIEGIDLNEPQREEIVAAIKRDLHKYRFLVFPNQGKMSAEAQLRVSEWFGTIS